MKIRLLSGHRKAWVSRFVDGCHRMAKSRRKILVVGLVFGFVFALELLIFRGRGNPKLTVTYLTRTYDSTSRCWVAQFAITNVGNAPAVSYKAGNVDVFGKAKGVRVAYRSKLHRLLPGEGEVVQVPLPPGLQGHWRFTAEYAREDIRSRIYDWQWGAGGPGMRVNWLVPRFLKGVPLNVTATSYWINE